MKNDYFKRLHEMTSDIKELCQKLNPDTEPDNFVNYSDEWKIVKFKDDSVMHVIYKTKIIKEKNGLLAHFISVVTNILPTNYGLSIIKHYDDDYVDVDIFKLIPIVISETGENNIE
jgi:hypothetical protein